MNAVTPITGVNSGSLADRAMLVSLSISQWSARRLDRKITDEVNTSHGAAADAGRYNKSLLPKGALEPIQKIVNSTRSEFAERTLPWLNDGSRIMAAEAYMAHTQWYRAQKAAFDQAVEEFLREYPNHVASAPARLNGMFDPDDFPSVDELRRKFSMDLQVMPVPVANDFRANVSEVQAEQIRSEIEASVRNATAAAMRDVYRRIAEATERMVERLSNYKPAQKKGERAESTFKNSLVENVRDLIKVMPSLNVAADPELDAIARRMEALVQYDADTLRQDEGKRRDVAAEAQAVLDSVSGFLA